MDREIPKEVRQRERRKQWIKIGAGVVAAVVVMGGMMRMMQSSLARKDLLFSTVDKGTIEVSVSASGKVVPAFEEIINSPINSRIVEVYKKGGGLGRCGDAYPSTRPVECGNRLQEATRRGTDEAVAVRAVGHPKPQ